VVLSIRNQFPGSVVAVVVGGVMSTVKVAEGTDVTALIKSTEVSIALP
jgi:molybdopterin-binding protein